MGKRESFLLTLIASFFFLLVFVTSLTVKEPGKERVLTPFKREVVLVATGDVMLGRSVLTKSERLKDWTYPFAKTATTLKEADLTLINLESPFVLGCPRTNEGMTFCADPRMVGGLKESGVDVANLANNHLTNYGTKGVEETKQVLTSNRIDWTGLGNLVIKEVKGTKFGFLGFDFTLRKPKEADYQLVKDADSKVGVLIVSLHWGNEYQAVPTDSQKAIAKNLIEAGADVIIGHHPHWVQSREEIGGKPVYYSLGNFVFDQPWSETTKKGMVVKLTFKDGRLTEKEALPIYMFSLGQPELVK